MCLLNKPAGGFYSHSRPSTQLYEVVDPELGSDSATEDRTVLESVPHLNNVPAEDWMWVWRSRAHNDVGKREITLSPQSKEHAHCILMEPWFHRL